MIEPLMWKRSLAALGASLLLGLTACSSADDDPDAADDPSSSDSTESDGATDDATSDESSDTSAPPTTKDPTEDGGFKYLPDCGELSQSIVEGEDVVDGEQVEGKSCRFTIGEDRVIGRQIVWIARGGGGWPEKFKAGKLNDKLAEAADPGDKKYKSKVREIDAPGWDYGLQFDEKVGKVERTSYRLLTFAENGDLLSCHTSVADVDLDAFRDWCDSVLETVEP